MANTGYTDSFGNSWDGGFTWDPTKALTGRTSEDGADPAVPGPTDNLQGLTSGPRDTLSGRGYTPVPPPPPSPRMDGTQSLTGTRTPPDANTRGGGGTWPDTIGTATGVNQYLLSGGSGTFGYHYDPAKGMYVDAQGNPANQTPTTPPTGYTPNTSPGVPTGYNPFNLTGSGLQSNPGYTANPGSGFIDQSLNQNYFATPEAAKAIAQQLGGTVVSRNYGIGGSSPDQLFIQLPNGLMVNAGNLLSIYQNPVFQQNQNVMQGEVLKLLNSGLNPDTMQPVQTQGAFTMGPDGKPTYSANASYKYPEQTLVPLQQYNAQNTALNRPPVTTGPISPLSSGTPIQYPTQQQQGQTQYPTQNGNNNQLAQLAQLAQFFQMLTGGQNLLTQQTGQSDLTTIMPLLLALLGQQEPQGALYRRSQYPRFP